jgi:predicted Zn-dependent peptidase
MIAIRAGSKNDPATATGLAHYLEHLVFKGTSKIGTLNWEKEKVLLESIENLYEVYRTKKDERERKFLYNQIDRTSFEAAKLAVPNEYDKLVGNLGAEGTNAYTWLDQTVYVNNIPSNAIERWAAIETERFGQIVPRLFHTELESVYEEKNRGLDNDGDKTFEAGFLALFPTHPYGTQTTIGTIEHLKNPSIKEIKKFFDTYYRPNNMAVIMAGDLDPTATIKIIDAQFGKLQSKEVPKYKSNEVPEMNQPEVRTVYGPNPATVEILFRLPAQSPKDQMTFSMINSMLNNSGEVGLLNVNLNQKQLVRDAAAAYYPFVDASVFYLSASPKEGQKLEEVKAKLLEQIENLKAGKIPAWLFEASKINTKRKIQESFKNNGSRVEYFINTFIGKYDYSEMIGYNKHLDNLTEADIINAAKETFKNNYVVVFKENGKDPNIIKVAKPTISPVPLNRDSSSVFYREVQKIAISEIKPAFVNLEKDVVRASVHSQIPVYYKQNTTDKLGKLYLIVETGTEYDNKLDLALRYLEFLGTNKLSSEDIKAEFYKLGLDYGISIGDKRSFIYVSGLDENIDKGLKLLLHKINDAKADETILKNLIADIKTERADAKKSKRDILFNGLVNYALYGPKNPFNNQLKDAELSAIKSDELIGIIQSLLKNEHKVLYYGPKKDAELSRSLTKEHVSKLPANLNKINHLKEFKLQTNTSKKVYFTDYDMVQAEFVFASKAGDRDDNTIPVSALFNEYFGGNMGSIVFSELRERKALAYSTFAQISETEPNDGYSMFAYIGCQADKTKEAISSMQELLVNMPTSQTSFDNAKQALMKRISTERVLDEQILFAALEADKWNRKQQTAEITWNALQSLTLTDVQNFQKKYVKPLPYSILAMGKSENLDFKALNNYAPVKELKLEELFGY